VLTRTLTFFFRFKELLPSNKIVIFLLKLLGFYILWLFLNGYLSNTNSPVFLKYWYGGYHILLKSAMFCSTHLIAVFSDTVITTTYRNITLGNHGSLYVANVCLGADVMFIFAAFVIAYPGQQKAKFWFIPVGIVAIHLVNILRITGLCLTKIYWPTMMDPNHHVIFNIIIFSFVFMLWIRWITHYSKDDLLANKSSESHK